MNYDIVVDLETLGVDPETSPIIQIGVAVVQGTEIIDGFSMCAEEVDFHAVDPKTLKWWLNTNSELLKRILIAGKGNSEKDLMVAFAGFIQNYPPENTALWGKGPEFDNAFLKAKFKKYGLDWELSFRQDRCVRTMEEFHEVLGLPRPENENPHNATDDAIYEAKMLIQVRKELTKHVRGI